MSTVLIIDDQSISRMILEELVRSIESGIMVESFQDPVQALEWAKNHSPDLILSDYKMPSMDGVEFTQWIRQIPNCADMPIVIITCVDDKAVRYRALEAGATDFLTKPVDHNECKARCRNLLTMQRQQRIIKDRARWLEREVEETTQKLVLRERETLWRLAKAGEYRDEDTGNHVYRMAKYSLTIAKTLGLDDEECDIIEHAAPMHDIGKIGIPDDILRKRGRLTAEEWAIMQRHTTIGYEILRDSPSFYLQAGAVIAYAHHEKYSGEGYPQGLAGNAIPLTARIVAVADVYDALVSERPYKDPWPMEKAVEYLSEQRGKHFDPDCVDAFLAQLDQIIRIQEIFTDVPKQSSH